ncbi:TIGR01841 family phasin [Roseococcus sp. SDR]|uniref:phasin family protein n=1 Tax=Roseococcus sp. SDR TaxID=2835532 RepID=UPI001BCB2245|nr:TIGR01841 family phasin [Roseococcus sp. SDR]MBS7791305.1 phasin family protein [Roseococcus sp. SDR]MBV1846619.1 TIGR01841 family phasin [Roseococcus sp. SDR]
MTNSFNPEEMMRAFTSMKMPGLPDFQAFADAQKRNLEALTTANKLAMEGAQAVGRRNMEIIQQVMAEMTQALQNLSAVEGSPNAKAAHQAEMMKAAYERAVANMQEIAELIQKSNGEAVGVLNRRFAEALEEVKSLVKS